MKVIIIYLTNSSSDVLVYSGGFCEGPLGLQRA